ncbi:GNAT family N-acetyltransferase/peptidase C39 family protein [Alkalimarinus alittae]|uniref:GNAT family N-acetyltransferase/peptidase C39 family protein n=1 Tax=Alkalimarinus alittae TaxID=2961619 RepID=A0ABY6MZS3_9ALTE|nr:GNAT family N-acetyltransferase/peptidase C39 family protein [Alkalimarinus alittae]UZE95345.1 GNAT family N-acetyltransferase/peptidase C39 family protein [Alkalimarinus alittae]
MSQKQITIEPAELEQVESLLQIEQKCFTSDRLSKRSMRRFILNEQAVFNVAMSDERCVGYILIIFHRGTRLARLYSIAVDPASRGQGIANQLMKTGEEEAKRHGAFYFRLEVNPTNTGAIALYKSLGFIKFGVLHDYYEDHSDALRMQKRIRYKDQASVHTALPWCRQSTPFTCGPAALMMAMSGLDTHYSHSQNDELQIWREATTIFMTSGHGGCHPLGLALSAKKRGFRVEAWINQQQPLFVDGVRSEDKKSIIERVHHEFVRQSEAENIVIHYETITQATLIDACNKGAVPIVLISTFRFDRKKAPHWVAVSGYDDYCFYVHDPDPDDKHQDQLDCQYLPIALQDFEPMSSFGANRLRTAIILYPSD